MLAWVDCGLRQHPGAIWLKVRGVLQLAGLFSEHCLPAGCGFPMDARSDIVGVGVRLLGVLLRCLAGVFGARNLLHSLLQLRANPS